MAVVAARVRQFVKPRRKGGTQHGVHMGSSPADDMEDRGISGFRSAVLESACTVLGKESTEAACKDVASRLT